MNIEDEARQEAERRWPSPNTGLYEGLIIGFEKGAVWASEQADREPSDAEVEAAARVVWGNYEDSESRTWKAAPYAEKVWARRTARAALIATQEVRDES